MSHSLILFELTLLGLDTIGSIGIPEIIDTIGILKNLCAVFELFIKRAAIPVEATDVTFLFLINLKLFISVFIKNVFPEPVGASNKYKFAILLSKLVIIVL
ncbi:hypothetical protein C6P40_004340 [Pichia californica]|uniref:Uncharacterized protein n=1 Tax=Pichia californica TaxID=460514 RepID=A0A9P7BEG9_9ASCO|nr:hypothetical protein C6P42_004078 [[Candida] californica]KAG0686358.1 hypothetical protein C6P40_004340 [[Candida] californica]